MIKTFKRQKGSLATGFTAFIVLSIVSLQVSSSLNQSDHKQSIYAPAIDVPALYPQVQGLYEICAPRNGSRCLGRLKQMAAAGFTLVLNYDQLSGNAREELAYAEQAHSLGIKIIWAMSNPVFWNGTDLVSYYSDLAATCKCSDNGGFIRYFVGLVKNLPATWGYYIGDEVSPKNHAKLKTFTDLVKQIDPSHPRLFIAGASSSATAISHLSPFTDTAEVLGADYYPVGSSSMPISATGDVASAVQSVADRYGKQSVMVLQSFSWSQYPNESWRCSPFPGCARFPTKGQMRQMRDLTVSNSHPKFILWYSYFDIFKSHNPSGHWKDLVEAASSN